MTTDHDANAEPNAIEAPSDNTRTDQTGQESDSGGRQPRFEVEMDDSGQWHWMLFSGNGRPLAVNAVPYPRRNDCTNAINIVRNAIKPDTRIYIAKD